MKTNSMLWLVAASLFAGCSSQKVDFDHARDADFASYQTYGWHEDDTSLRDENMLAHERVIAAVDGQMSAKGFRQVDSNPDVYVTYRAEDQENMSLDTTTMGYGYGPGWGWGGYYGGMGGMGSSTTQVRTYTTGTLVVDIWDSGEKALVWRGIASDTVSDDPRKNAEKIDSAIAKMFENYPPPSGN